MVLEHRGWCNTRSTSSLRKVEQTRFQNLLLLEDSSRRPLGLTVHWKKDNFVNFFLPLNHFFWIPIENLGILGAVKVHSHPPFVKFSQIFGIF